MATNDYFTPRENQAFLNAIKNAEERLRRHKIIQPTQALPIDRQKVAKARGRPRKADPKAVLEAWEIYCLGTDWSKDPEIGPFLETIGISASLFREIRRQHREAKKA